MALERDQKLAHRIAQFADEGETSVLPSTDIEVKHPSHYKVLLHNDDFTPMDFVIDVLESIFHKDNSLAKKIMFDVHTKGLGICGVYPYEVAETKVVRVNDRARKEKYPLKCTMEED